MNRQERNNSKPEQSPSFPNWWTIAKIFAVLGIAWGSLQMAIDYLSDPNRVTKDNWRDHYPQVRETVEAANCPTVGPNDYSILTPFSDELYTGTIENPPEGGSTTADGTFAITLGGNLKVEITGANFVINPQNPCPDTSYFVSHPDTEDVEWNIQLKGKN